MKLPLRARDGSVRAWALIDKADEEAVGGVRWSLHSTGYAYRLRRTAGVVETVRLHRLLLGLGAGDPRQVDHINRDRLDNRRANLRVCTLAENRQNVSSRPGSSSRYRGVSLYKRTGRWQANARVNGVSHHLGLFGTEEEAAAVASEFRAKHMPHSEDARLAAMEGAPA